MEQIMWNSALQFGENGAGEPLLSVLGKRTYRFSPDGAIDVEWDNPVQLFETQVFFGKGDVFRDPVKQDADLVAWKPLVDFVVHGKAHAPKGKQARYFDAGVVVAGQPKMVRIFGNRKIDLSSGGIRFTEPELFEEMPLHWGLAYGGVDDASNPAIELVYPRNPVGKGFFVAPPPEKLHGRPLPNLENPNQLLHPDALLVKRFDRWKLAPVPMALGWTSRSFQDRVQASVPAHPGRIPQPSPNAAPAFLRLPRLAGTESVVLGYMDAEFPRLEFSLPGDVPNAFLDAGKGAAEMPVALQTIEVYPSSRMVTLLWRAAIRLPEGFNLEDTAGIEGWMESDFK